jgi:hypothetical protein
MAAELLPSSPWQAAQTFSASCLPLAGSAFADGDGVDAKVAQATIRLSKAGSTVRFITDDSFFGTLGVKP